MSVLRQTSTILKAKQQNLSELNKIQLLSLNKGSHKAYKKVYELYFISLFKYALTFVHEKELAQEFVHEAFLMIWEKRTIIYADFNLKAYLYKSIHNQALNYIRHQKIAIKHFNEISRDKNNKNIEALPEPFLKEDIANAINELPKRLKQVFILSRIEGLKHREISEQLAISEKTVEVHIRNARIILRKKLKKYYRELSP